MNCWRSTLETKPSLACTGVQFESGAIELDTENTGGIVGWGSEDESFEVREGIRVNPDKLETHW